VETNTYHTSCGGRAPPCGKQCKGNSCTEEAIQENTKLPPGKLLPIRAAGVLVSLILTRTWKELEDSPWWIGWCLKHEARH